MDKRKRRAVDSAWYMLEKRATIRETAKIFAVSKSTVHKDLTERLPKISETMAKDVREVLDSNLRARSIRGGNATKEKYRIIRESNSIQ